MTTEKMTVHKALCELKILNGRIQKEIAGNLYVDCVKNGVEKLKGIPIKEYSDGLKASLDKVESLIKRREAIKKAVVLSNAVTKVTVNGVEYTVAEAIELNNSGMDYYKKLSSKLESQLSAVRMSIDANSGVELERRADEYVKNILGTQSSTAKLDTSVVEALRKEFVKNNTINAIDPNNVAAKIEQLKDYIDAFESEVDSALSTSNALTVIEVNY